MAEEKIDIHRTAEALTSLREHSCTVAPGSRSSFLGFTLISFRSQTRPMANSSGQPGTVLRRTGQMARSHLDWRITQLFPYHGMTHRHMRFGAGKTFPVKRSGKSPHVVWMDASSPGVTLSLRGTAIRKKVVLVTRLPWTHIHLG